MKKIFIISILFFCGPLFSGNYIDNPNFDLGDSGWSTSLNNGKILAYNERIRQQTICDQYLSIPADIRLCLYLPIMLIAKAVSTGVFPYIKKCGSSFYTMYSVPINIPLYFTSEISYEAPSSPKIEVEIMECPNHHNLYSCWTLSRKAVIITGNEHWHLITSDYPAYKTKTSTELLLRISFGSFDGNFQLNYAQVGTDPKNLGGRGPRAKNMN